MPLSVNLVHDATVYIGLQRQTGQFIRISRQGKGRDALRDEQVTPLPVFLKEVIGL
jgi:hypothetical protein